MRRNLEIRNIQARLLAIRGLLQLTHGVPSRKLLPASLSGQSHEINFRRFPVMWPS